eukprot:scpid7682/ scgid33592/ Probable valine--tRNA ligase, mitochondrial; Valyl-tRNA synthetase
MRLGQVYQVGRLCRHAWVRSLSTSPCRSQMDNTREFPKDFPPQFDAKLIERWYSKWEADGAFKGGGPRSGGKKYNMLLPPPNVTGKLHIGHALTIAQEDALCRWHRLCGDDVQYVPGTDHAGIATQSLVERLLKDKGMDVAGMSREDRLKHVMKWKEEHGDHIVNQLRKLGVSVDWSQEYFTLDEPRAESVKHAFIQLFNRGLIYRRVRFANWCCSLKTVISDIEVEEEHYDEPTRISVAGYDGQVEVGLMHHVAYPLEDGGEVVVATTRPETIPADAALAVHPDDLRYTHLHGKRAMNPVTKKHIPIICDEQLVDMEKGTGIVKVTPCHDQRDYECGLRHDLPQEMLFDEDGCIALSDGERVHRFAARRLILESLRQTGLYRHAVKHPMLVQRCSRSGDIIEPILYPQWFLRMGDLCKHAVKAVDSGELKITPTSENDVWKRWLSKEQDWCLSRQLYWGHRIPAWRVVDGLPNQKNNVEEQSIDDEVWVASDSEAEAKQMAIASHGCDPEKVSVVQETDVLDTWFSSALLPLSTAGWPSSEITDFYPLSVMETGNDILFFWVARMYMLCTTLHPQGQSPFSHILLHPLVKDASGAKMSKSKGNVVDPLDIMNGASYEKLLGSRAGSTQQEDKLKALHPDAFPACGADSLRFYLNKSTSVVVSNVLGDINFDLYEVILARNFAKKMWNGVRFAYMIWPPGFEASPLRPDGKELGLLDRWVMHTTAKFVADYDQAMQSHNLAVAANLVQEYVRDRLCTQYFEFVKVQADVNESLDILYHTLSIGLQAAHPLMPFVTEDLWQRLPHPKGTSKSILNSTLPRPSELSMWLSPDLDEKRATFQGIANFGKKTMSEFKPKSLILCTTQREFLKICEENQEMLRKYFFVPEFVVKGEMPSDTSNMVSAPVNSFSTFFAYCEDVQAAGVYESYANKLKSLTKLAEKLKKTLANPGYTKQVPEEKQQSDRRRLEETQLHMVSIEHSLTLLPKIQKKK